MAVEPSIISRPTYGTLALHPGRAHLVITDAAGAGAVIDMIAAAPGGMPAAMQILHVTGRGAAAAEARAALAALGAEVLAEAPTVDAALHRLGGILPGLRMGTRIYLAGGEGLIGRAMAAVNAAGIAPGAVLTEHRGSLARRVQCLHCKGITEEVTTNPCTCAHCGLVLEVRDHYSRRLAAFQGVCINAEDWAEPPVPEEVFR